MQLQEGTFCFGAPLSFDGVEESLQSITLQRTGV